MNAIKHIDPTQIVKVRTIERQGETVNVYVNLDQQASWLFVLSNLPMPLLVSASATLGLVAAMFLLSFTVVAIAAMNMITMIVLGLAGLAVLVIALGLMVRR